MSKPLLTKEEAKKMLNVPFDNSKHVIGLCNDLPMMLSNEIIDNIIIEWKKEGYIKQTAKEEIVDKMNNLNSLLLEDGYDNDGSAIHLIREIKEKVEAIKEQRDGN